MKRQQENYLEDITWSVTGKSRKNKTHKIDELSVSTGTISIVKQLDHRDENALIEVRLSTA